MEGRDDQGPLYDWIGEHFSRLDAENSNFRIMLKVHSEKEGGADHAIAFQFRYKPKKVGNDLLQVNMLNMNKTLFKMKKLKWGKQRDQQKWQQAITEYPATFQQKYDTWRLSTFV